MFTVCILLSDLNYKTIGLRGIKTIPRPMNSTSPRHPVLKFVDPPLVFNVICGRGPRVFVEVNTSLTGCLVHFQEVSSCHWEVRGRREVTGVDIGEGDWLSLVSCQLVIGPLVYPWIQCERVDLCAPSLKFYNMLIHTLWSESKILF